MSVLSGKIEVFNFLMTLGAKINATDKDGNTVLHLALEGEDLDFIKYILSIFKEKNMNVDTKNLHEITPLFFFMEKFNKGAVKKSHDQQVQYEQNIEKILEVLIKEGGANIDEEDDFGNKLLKEANEKHQSLMKKWSQESKKGH